MAIGDVEASDDDDVVGKCGVFGSSPKGEEPDCSPTIVTESDPRQSSSGAANGFRTYKRRKQVEKSSVASRNGRRGTPNSDGAVQLENKTTVELQNRASEGTAIKKLHFSTLHSHEAANDVSDSSPGKWSKVVLEQINQSLSEYGGLSCISKAVHHSNETQRTKLEESIIGIEGSPGQHTQAGWMCNDSAANGVRCTSNGSLDDSSRQSINDMCQSAVYDVIISGKFNQLCKLLLENYQGGKFDHLLDFGLIISRMKEGFYERSPERFLPDFGQVWRKLEEIGLHVVSLAKSLADLSRISCHKHIGQLMEGRSRESTSNEENNKVHLQDHQLDTKLEQAEDSNVFKVCSCRHCGERADGRECLICDSCEDLYHVSCIEPAVEEIPLLNWYCTRCISNGKRSTHKDCVVCKKLYASGTASNGVTKKPTVDKIKKDLAHSGENNNSMMPVKNSFGLCSICGSNMFEDEIIRECSHSLCPRRNYHERCLTAKQLKSYGPYWYCPSCLCRTCLSDQDDDKIVLCDACDHAYHIYCVKPRLSKIPAGKWFCNKCEAGLQAILRVKRACEGVNVKGKRGRKKVKERAPNRGKRKRINEESVKVGGGGMDMLLNAANTLNLEENSAAKG